MSNIVLPRRVHWLATLLGAVALTSAPALATDVPGKPQTLTVNVDRGQMISIISAAPKAGDDAAQVRSAYGRSGFALARQFGMQPFGSLNVSKVIIGDFAPRAVAFYRWNSADDERAFDQHPDWLPIKETRPQGWDDLRLHDAVVDTSHTLTFSSDKFYTLATAWTNPDRPDDYDRYLENVESAVHAAGGRFMYQMVTPRFSSLKTLEKAPSRITIVEWDQPAALEDFLQSEGFEKHAPLLTSGTVGFELLGLTLPDA